MPRYEGIKKVLVLGSGPIIIGQAAEFDYAGTQACRSLKEEGLEVVLINSNPATIMTDRDIADRVYIEPMNIASVKQIIEIEKPDSILPGLGGQTGLNLSMQLAEEGFLQENNVRMLGTSAQSIKMAEDRQSFKDTMESIGQPCVESRVVGTVDEALEFASGIGYPVIVRPGYTLGGTGGGIAYNKNELKEIALSGIRASRVSQILIERCITGWKEIEFEVMRDRAGNCITICSMENIDPVGVHTGDSIVCAPTQTLGLKEFSMLRNAALAIIDVLKIEGGCNVQFALHPNSFEYAVIEVNPRVSRSSALASKATGYPIAKVTSKIALGYTLDEIKNSVTGSTWACFEPSIDYVVVKIPKWPFDKFLTAKRTLGTQMKATGEVMAIANSFEGAIMKAVRSLEQNVQSLQLPKLESMSRIEIMRQLSLVDDERLFVMAEAIRRGITPEEINEITKVDLWFLDRIQEIVDMENQLRAGKPDEATLKSAKDMCFTDRYIAQLCGAEEREIKEKRVKLGFTAAFKMVDTCAGEYDASTPYYYSTYDKENEAGGGNKKKVLVLGSGPIRIGQGIEFDYCSVHSVWALKKLGLETIIINNNPETVSTDFDVADKLYFEPLTPEDVANVVELEKPWGAVVQFGGQTAIKLTKALTEMGVPILGTALKGVDDAEDREKFDKILEQCDIKRAAGKTVYTEEEALAAANELGYPVLVRPSYVLGGQGMEIAYTDQSIAEYIGIINRVEQENPILIDKYLLGREIEVDAICDGDDILIPGIMEHIERAGVHSGDSISIYPTIHVDEKHMKIITEYTKKLSKALNVIGLVNIQFIIYNDDVYVIEVNPRSSRTVPYISKVTGVPVIELATRAMLGEKLKDMGYGTGLYKTGNYFCVKMPVFSFEKLMDVDTSLGPEMKSTGEVLGIAETFPQALLKAFKGVGMNIPKKGGDILITVNDEDKGEIIGIAESFVRMDFSIYATEGTCNALEKAGIKAGKLNKLTAGYPTIIDMIEEGRADLIINTPTKGRKQFSDGFKIRRAAVEHSVPCVTSIDTARALVTARTKGKSSELRPLDISKIFD